MACEAHIVYWQPAGDAPCDYCLDAEGYYAVDDCPDSHDLCQCIMVEIDAPAEYIEYEDFEESSTLQEYTYEWTIVGFEDVRTMDSAYGVFHHIDSDEELYEGYEDDCFQAYCQENGGIYDASVDIEGMSDDVIEVPPGYDWEGEIIFTYMESEFSAGATSIYDDGESSEATALGMVTGWALRLILIEHGDGELVEK